MTGFVKLYSTITSSSVWSENKDVRILWITILSQAGADGIVKASIPGLARYANLTIAECEAALEILEAPDCYSRSKNDEGRRIRALEGGGWLVINHQKYREMRTESQIKGALRVARHRARKSIDQATASPVIGNACNAPEADADADAKRKNYVRAQGSRLLAQRLINRVRTARNPIFPKALLAGWEAQFSPGEIEVVKAFSARILEGHPKDDGVLCSQIADGLAYSVLWCQDNRPKMEEAQ